MRKRIAAIFRQAMGVAKMKLFVIGIYLKRLFRRHAIVVEDVYDIKFIYYPWEKRSLRTLLRKEYYREEFQALEKLIRPKDTVFDVGANVGIFSVFLSRLAMEGGKVFAFEPVPETYWRLRENLALNRCLNVLSIQMAVSDREGVVAMNIFPKEYSDWNTMGKPVMSSPEGDIVPCESTAVTAVTLDDFCKKENIDHIDFLKVDVEGFEKNVFLGARQLLREKRIGYICFEISEEPLKGAGIAARDVFALLESYEYLVYKFDHAHDVFQGPIHSSSEYYANYFASWKNLNEVR
ncbi:MAG: FkbM family methyltransferase [Candidatus Omnitrophota bacterium]